MTKNNKVRLIIKVMIIEKILKNIKNRKINWNNQKSILNRKKSDY